WIASFFILTYAVLGVVLPLIAVVLSSFLPFPGVYTDIGFENYILLFSNPEISNILGTTAFTAGAGGALGVLFAFAIAYVASRTRSLASAFLRGVTLLQIAMPGIVGALALI